MADVEEHPVARELRRIAEAQHGYGIYSALARATGATPTSTAEWLSGRTVPGERWWPAIEKFFDLREGHLKRVSRGWETKARTGQRRSGNAVSQRDVISELQALTRSLQATIERQNERIASMDARLEKLEGGRSSRAGRASG